MLAVRRPSSGFALRGMAGGRIGVRRTLDGPELVRLQRDHGETRREEMKVLDVERAAKELRHVAAGALDISVRVAVRASDHPPDAGIVIAFDERERRQLFGQ